MATLKNLSDLGDAYQKIMTEGKNNPPPVVESNNNIIPTDTTRYLSESAKTGDALGSDAKAADLAPGRGPTAAGGFKKVSKQQDTGSDKELMKDSAEGKTDPKANTIEVDASKFTSPKEKPKVNKESASLNTKYNKPNLSMSKSKFDELYENAIRGVPFINEDGEVPIPAPASDDQADLAGLSGGEVPADAAPTDENEFSSLSTEELVGKLEQIVAALKSKGAVDSSAATDVEAGADELADGPAAGGPPTHGEAVDAEDLGTPNDNLKKGKPDSVKKPVVVGTALKTQPQPVSDTKVEVKFEPTPKPKDFDKKLQNTKKFDTGSLKTGKMAFDNP